MSFSRDAADIQAMRHGVCACGRRIVGSARIDSVVCLDCGMTVHLMPSADSPACSNPGWHLEQIIPSSLHSSGCGCAAYARKMDRWGVEGCEQRFDRIVRRLVVMAIRQGYGNPLQRFVARRWVRQAIDRASADLTHISEY